MPVNHRLPRTSCAVVQTRISGVALHFRSFRQEFQGFAVGSQPPLPTAELRRQTIAFVLLTNVLTTTNNLPTSHPLGPVDQSAFVLLESGRPDLLLKVPQPPY